MGNTAFCNSNGRWIYFKRHFDRRAGYVFRSGRMRNRISSVSGVEIQTLQKRMEIEGAAKVFKWSLLFLIVSNKYPTAWLAAGKGKQLLFLPACRRLAFQRLFYQIV